MLNVDTQIAPANYKHKMFQSIKLLLIFLTIRQQKQQKITQRERHTHSVHWGLRPIFERPKYIIFALYAWKKYHKKNIALQIFKFCWPIYWLSAMLAYSNILYAEAGKTGKIRKSLAKTEKHQFYGFFTLQAISSKINNKFFKKPQIYLIFIENNIVL